MKVKIINGPNLNRIGQREKEIYGDESLETYFEREFSNEKDLIYFQSNIEGELINEIQKNDCDAIIINAGGYTHTSVAIRDAIGSISIPVVEVHISNLSQRESFRHTSLISPVCIGCIFGFGLDGYHIALNYLTKIKN